MKNLKETIRERILYLGFSRCGFTTAEPLGGVHLRRWERWRAEDKAGEMTWLAREQPRRTHPRDLLPEAQTAVVVLAGYYDGDHGAPPRDEGAAGKVARYAWGRDYHLALRERLTRLGEWVAARAAELGVGEAVTFRACVDSAPLDERALAVRAGLGFIGKNTLLLNPENGSWGLIGVLLLSLKLPPDEDGAETANREGVSEHDYDYEHEHEHEHERIRLKKEIPNCGSCRRCLEACPTGALDFRKPYQLDPRRCISYLTIEQKGGIAPELAEKMNGWAFGCDICQEVCPFNARPLARLLPELAAGEGAGPYISERRLNETPTGKAFLRRWGQTPLARPGLKGLRRNLGL